jgi:hypothetical protein
MKLYTLDNLVRSALADKSYPMHWYLQFLKYGIDGFRMLNFDVLRNVKSVRLPVNSYKAVTMPCDFVDYIRIGDEVGQYITPWGEKESFNRLNKFDANGNKVAYGDIEATNGLLPADWEGFWYTNYTNDKGEHLGRIFNNFSSFRNSFEVLRERNEIQLDTSYTGTEITMDYLTDGVSADSTTAIHPYAHDCIVAYIFWKMKEHSRAYNLSERAVAKEEFYNQLRVLKGRMNNIDVNMIRRSLAGGYGPVIRN